jgi:rod shape-determining protein MreD
MRKYGYILLLVLAFAILQPTLLFSLGISIYMPDVVAVIVAAQAFTRSYRLGASIAVIAGLFVDLLAPNAGTLGVSSLAYLVVAVLIHRYVRAPHDSPWRPVLAAAAAPGLAVMVRAIVLLLTNQPAAFSQLPAYLGSQLISGLIFAAFLVPVIDLLDRPLYRDSLPLRVGA